MQSENRLKLTGGNERQNSGYPWGGRDYECKERLGWGEVGSGE